MRLIIISLFNVAQVQPSVVFAALLKATQPLGAATQILAGSHVTTKQRCKYITSVGIQKINALLKDSHSFRITCERSESARERRIALYKSDQQQEKRACVRACVRACMHIYLM